MSIKEPELLELVRGAAPTDGIWIVGGSVRDRLAGAQPRGGAVDLDLIVDGDSEAVARALRAAAPAGAAVFALSEQFGAWRVHGADGEWQIDCTPLQGATLEADLRARDLTINAIAEPLAGGEMIDPTGGIDDLQRGLLRMAGAQAFAADPLRCVRLARFAVQLGFEIEPETLAAAQSQPGGLREVAGERIFTELNLILASSEAVGGIRLLDEIGASAVVLPELLELQGVEQTAYHHLDAYEHTLEVLQFAIDLENDPAALFGDVDGAAVAAVLAEPLADGLSRGGGLRWGALLHDIAKPQTRAQFDDGRIGFPGHAAEGAEQSREILGRLKASEKLRAHVSKLTLEHLRLGFLVHEQPLTAEALYLYLTNCQPVEVDVTLLSLVDRLATRGRKAEQAITAHQQLALEVLTEALRWRADGPPEPLIRGDLLASELGIEHGPLLGSLLEAIAEAQYCGTVSDQAAAVELARALISADS
jgi:putative nucleotidyltransferase with HDIG domain